MKRWSLDARSKGQPGYALPYWLIVVHEVEGVESDGHLCSRNARPIGMCSFDARNRGSTRPHYFRAVGSKLGGGINSGDFREDSG